MSGIIGGIKGSMKKKFVPVVAGDANWSNVSLLLNGDTVSTDPYRSNVSLMLTGEDFIDWSNQHNAITNNGSVTLNTTTKKFNASSLYFNGSTQNLTLNASSNFNFGTDNFTIECWFNQTSKITSYPCLVNFNGPWAANVFELQVNTDDVGNKICFSARNGGANILVSTTQPVAGTWYHVAVVKSGSSLLLFVNGVQEASASYTSDISGGNSTANIGGISSKYFNGYIADMRITKGVARYTTNFTVPTAALPSYRISDASSNSLSITPYGNTQINTSTVKYGTGSMYFDNSSYLTIPYSSLFNFPSDFTIEMWVNPSTQSGNWNSVYGNYSSWTSNTGALQIFAGHVSADSTRWSIAFNGTFPFITGPVYTVNAWSHIALVRFGSTFTFYVNGVASGTATSSQTVAGSTDYIRIGTATDDLAGGTFSGYIDDLRVTKGLARYTANFTPPTSALPTSASVTAGADANWSGVRLLLTGDDLLDRSSSPRTITNNSATVNTSTKKYGTGSIGFTTGASLVANSFYPIGTSDFTIELWAYLSSSTSNWACMIATRPASGVGGIWLGIESGTGKPTLYTSSITGASAMPLNTWQHIAVCRTGGTITLYVNGVSAGSASDSKNYSETTAYIGRDNPYNGFDFPGYIDDLRVTIGTARYTTNFTPPTAALPVPAATDSNISSVVLLLTGDDLLDKSPSAKSMTVAGNTVVNTSTKKYGTGSLYFDGNGDYIYPTSASADFNYGTGNFTIEFWVYSLSGPAGTYNPTFFTNHGDGDWSGGGTGLRIHHSNTLFGSGTQLNYSSNIPNNQWVHVALVRNGTTITMYHNGTSVGSVTSFTGSVGSSTDRPAFATSDGVTTGGREWPNCYMDDMRITKGVARYTSNFTPPTTALPTA
jgi:hypothetical protein